MPGVGTKEALELSNQYGIANVLVVILVLFFIGLFLLVLRWVFKTMDSMMTKSHDEKIALAGIVNTGVKNLTDALSQNTHVCQQIMSNLKDGFDKVSKADEFHRSDLRDVKASIIEGHAKAESGRERIMNAISDQECKAK